jgi:hypothetical protein
MTDLFRRAFSVEIFWEDNLIILGGRFNLFPSKLVIVDAMATYFSNQRSNRSRIL